MQSKVPAKRDERKDLQLTSAQERLLDVLRDVKKSVQLDVTEICKLANVARGTYYEAFKDENFLKALEVELAAYRASRDFAVMHTIAEKAIEGKNSHWAQLFERLQNRLQEGGTKPAHVVVIIGNNIERPKWIDPDKIIEGHVVEDAS
jgi:hypothetical protein